MWSLWIEGSGWGSVGEWAERSTRFMQLVYGLEGCGKSAWLKQAAELLKELGYDVIYVNPLQRESPRLSWQT